MPKVAVYDMNGSQVDEIELSDAVFGIEPHAAVLHDAVVMQLASMRRGTHAVKNRAAVRGGGRKPWRQKGTGRARHGSIRSPLWVGAGLLRAETPQLCLQIAEKGAPSGDEISPVVQGEE